ENVSDKFGHRNCVILHGDQPGVRPSARRAAAPLSCAENARRARFFGNALATNFSYEATRRILSPARLPFRHAGVLEGAKEYGLRGEAQMPPTKSSGCMLRGGPKTSRKIIASRKPDFDLSNAAKSVFV